MGLSDRVVLARDQAFEQWNGKGRRKLAGDDIGLAIRIAQVAALAGLFHQLGGPEAATYAVQQRTGRTLDPNLAAMFRRKGAALLAELDDTDLRAAVIDTEPEPRRFVAGAGVWLPRAGRETLPGPRAPAGVLGRHPVAPLVDRGGRC
jgi:hypothetical protein